MATALARTFKPTRSRVLTVVVVLAILFGCYGLLSAQQARSATTLPKQHITAVSHAGRGLYVVTFDRHVDNCAIEVTARLEGEGSSYNQFQVAPWFSTSQVEVAEVDGTASSFTDGDFDIFGMCPSS